MKYEATILHNMSSRFTPYRRGDVLLPVARYEIEGEGDFLEEIFERENIGDHPGRRSLSVGDVVVLQTPDGGRQRVAAVAPIGYNYVEADPEDLPLKMYEKVRVRQFGIDVEIEAIYRAEVETNPSKLWFTTLSGMELFLYRRDIQSLVGMEQ